MAGLASREAMMRMRALLAPPAPPPPAAGAGAVRLPAAGSHGAASIAAGGALHSASHRPTLPLVASALQRISAAAAPAGAASAASLALQGPDAALWPEPAPEQPVAVVDWGLDGDAGEEPAQGDAAVAGGADCVGVEGAEAAWEQEQGCGAGGSLAAEHGAAAAGQAEDGCGAGGGGACTDQGRERLLPAACGLGDCGGGSGRSMVDGAEDGLDFDDNSMAAAVAEGLALECSNLRLGGLDFAAIRALCCE